MGQRGRNGPRDAQQQMGQQITYISIKTFGPSFDIICNTSTKPEKPYVIVNVSAIVEPVEVMETSGSRIRVKYPYLLSAACDNLPGELYNFKSDAWYVMDLMDTQYTLAEENWITAIGCEDVVLGRGNGQVNGLRTACVTYCDKGYYTGGVGFCPDSGNGYSGGHGCCRASIPRGTSLVMAQLNDLGARWQGGRRYPCSFAFIQEKGIANQSSFSYPLSYLNNSTGFGTFDSGWKMSDVPLVVLLEWRIVSENCSRARRNASSFACRENSECVDFDANVGGYICRCRKGYDGNPYLPGGCQSINKCEDYKNNPCNPNSICTNNLGSITCLCPKGYYGDGKKNGIGCIRPPQPNVLVNILTGLGSGLGFLLFVAKCLWIYKESEKRRKRMRKEKFFKQNGGLIFQQQTNERMLRKTKHFSAEELEKATDNFHESRVLGEGGQGTVYKGILSDGKIVAIKKSKAVDESFLEQFINELVILSQINHRNVVKLLEFCLETEVPMLVYEFLPNGTLYDLIHDPNTKPLVSWNLRLKIATDIAGALAYIHSASSIPIYHRDIKSKNFLVDEKYVVKLADFGISRTVAVNQTHLSTVVRGTFGYLDPEYFHSSRYSEKSEVYSYGVVLAELLTGKRPVFSESEETESLAARFLECKEENSLEAVLDPQVFENGKEDELMAMARLAERCLNLKRKRRPTMKEVATELESLRIMSRIPACVSESEEDTTISDIQDTYSTCVGESEEDTTISDIQDTYSTIIIRAGEN